LNDIVVDEKSRGEKLVVQQLAVVVLVVFEFVADVTIVDVVLKIK
jgi:hypothetical protein